MALFVPEGSGDDATLAPDVYDAIIVGRATVQLASSSLSRAPSFIRPFIVS